MSLLLELFTDKLLERPNTKTQLRFERRDIKKEKEKEIA